MSYIGIQRKYWLPIGSLKAGKLRVINAILIVLLVISIGKLVLLLVSKPARPGISTVQPETGIAVGYSLYSAGVTSHNKLPEARIRAKVLGLVSSGDKSFATILVDGGKQAVYKKGDRITGSVTVEEIGGTGVVVREQGVLRRISIDHLGAGQNVAFIEESTSEGPQASGVNDILESIDTSLEMVDGVTGLRVHEVPESVSSALGLQAGDLITAIDGIAIGDSPGGQATRELLLQKLNQGVTVTIDLLDEGQVRQIRIDQSRLELIDNS